nr:hypothetical protein [candidate division Zixibacteria bacterium]
MRQLLLSVAILLVFAVSLAYGERVELGSESGYTQATVLESNDSRIVVEFNINAFDKNPVEINGEKYFEISCDRENILLNEGEPALPRLCRSIIIPDDARMEIKILSAEYTDYPETPVIPSKGNLPRTVNPEDIPYTFGDIYGGSEWYPGELATIREPYILRDYRGTVIEFNGFQYNPGSKTLRVYKSVMVEIANVGLDDVNILQRSKNRIDLVRDFETIYERRFLNYDYVQGKYTPVQESGDMLIIANSAFYDAMLPLVEWKRQKGIKTTLVNVSTIGNDSTSIKNYIKSVYDIDSALAWVLLVGDETQVRSLRSGGGGSDPRYALVKGSDNYPDIFVGRFSAENVTQVETQVTRTLTYEMNPPGSGWFHMATGVASNLGPGHDGGEYDNVHMGYIRDDLLGYNYTLVDEIYDPSASAAMVTAALNSGRSFVNYCGHGGTTSWTTTGFSNSNVNALTNDNMTPFVFSVACLNGNFTSSTCFGEAWLRATNNGVPTGAIAAYMSSINQDWNPPMDAQDEATDLLCAEDMLTIGGLCYNASCRMIDDNGSIGISMYNTWHIFGDPSVMMRTLDPAVLTVNHSATIIFTLTGMDVQVVGVEGAVCALYKDGVVYGTGITGSDGMASITFDEELPIGENITLTVTAYNAMPYTGEVTVIAPQGPFVLFDNNDIDDGLGNGDGLVNCGESILLDVQLENVGP